MRSPKSLTNRTVHVVSSEEPHYEREMSLAKAIDAARADLGDIISGEIVLRNERGDRYTLTFDDNE